MLVSATGVLRTEGFPYALDNGAWTAFQAGLPINLVLFMKALMLLGRDAEWVALPDIVAGGLPSLELSLAWMRRVLCMTERVLIPVQDGMVVDDVRPFLNHNVGVFVGGDPATNWKEETTPAWAKSCDADRGDHDPGGSREHRRRCRARARGRHRARQRVVACMAVHVDLGRPAVLTAPQTGDNSNYHGWTWKTLLSQGHAGRAHRDAGGPPAPRHHQCRACRFTRRARGDLGPASAPASVASAHPPVRRCIRGLCSVWSSAKRRVARVKPKSNALAQHRWTGEFNQHAYLAVMAVSKNRNTRTAYLYDLGAWTRFAGEHQIDLFRPLRKHADLWIADMTKRKVKAKTRARRIASMCSVYRELRRPDGDNEPGVVTFNPFSVDEGSKREATAQADRPTPIASTADVRKLLDTCAAGAPLDLRDAAIIRLLWATGARRASLLDMRLERLLKDRAGYVTDLVVKGSKTVRVLITGRAREALDAWLAVVEAGGIATGPVWRVRSSGTLSGNGMYDMFVARSRAAKLAKNVTPHMLRVAFLTLNGATLEERQHGVGHANPATTQLYDRTAWRGRAAFEKMPEIEDAEP